MTETLPRLSSLQACDQRIREALHTLDRLRASLAALEQPALANVQAMQVCHDKIKEATQARDVFAAQLDQRYKQAAARNGKTIPATTSQTALVHV